MHGSLRIFKNIYRLEAKIDESSNMPRVLNVFSERCLWFIDANREYFNTYNNLLLSTVM